MDNGLHFAVYKHVLELENGLNITREFIVLRDDTVIVAWTDFHKYIKHKKRKTSVLVTSSGSENTTYICQFLNYIFIEKGDISRLTDINAEMVISFFNAYGSGSLFDGDAVRDQKTVDICFRVVIDFLTVYSSINKNKKMKFKLDDLYDTIEVRTPKGKIVKKKVPKFDIICTPKENTIFRDMPNSVFPIIMNHIIRYHPRIMMLVALCAFAGVRPSEACNVRREDSMLGAGLQITIINGSVFDITIDLNKELRLSSTCSDVGKIKKERTQRVYPAFRKIFYDIYLEYLAYLEGKPYEKAYGALSINSRGNAISYSMFAKEFKEAIKELIPILKDNPNSEVSYYGSLLEENSIGPHIFRHWFSTQLALYGESPAGLMFWRGDKSPDSARTYLQNKSDLVSQLATVNSKSFELNLWRAEKAFSKEYLDG